MERSSKVVKYMRKVQGSYISSQSGGEPSPSPSPSPPPPLPVSRPSPLPLPPSSSSSSSSSSPSPPSPPSPSPPSPPLPPPPPPPLPLPPHLLNPQNSLNPQNPQNLLKPPLRLPPLTQEAKSIAQEAKETADIALLTSLINLKSTTPELAALLKAPELASKPPAIIDVIDFIDYFNHEMYTAYEMIIDVNQNFDGSPVHPQINYVLLPYLIEEEESISGGGQNKKRSNQKGGTNGKLRFIFCCFNVNHAKYDDEVTWVYNPDFEDLSNINEDKQKEMCEAFAKFHQLIEKINKVEEVLNKKAEVITNILQNEKFQLIANNVKNHIKKFCDERLKEILMLNVTQIIPGTVNNEPEMVEVDNPIKLEMDILHFEAYLVYIGALMQEIARHMTRYRVRNGVLELTIKEQTEQTEQMKQIIYYLNKQENKQENKLQYNVGIMISGQYYDECISFPCLIDKLKGKSYEHSSILSFTVELKKQGLINAHVTRKIVDQLIYDEYIQNIKKWFNYKGDLYTEYKEKQVGTFQYKNIYYRNDMLINSIATTEITQAEEAVAEAEAVTVAETEAVTVAEALTLAKEEAKNYYFIGDVVSKLMMYNVL